MSVGRRKRSILLWLLIIFILGMVLSVAIFVVAPCFSGDCHRQSAPPATTSLVQELQEASYAGANTTERQGADKQSTYITRTAWTKGGLTIYTSGGRLVSIGSTVSATDGRRMWCSTEELTSLTDIVLAFSTARTAIGSSATGWQDDGIGFPEQSYPVTDQKHRSIKISCYRERVAGEQQDAVND